MPIDWILGLVGGLIIGSAAAIYLLVNGRVMGASGVIGGLIDRTGWHDWAERAAFLAGLVLLPLALVLTLWPTETHITANWIVILSAGLMVGIGTRLAQGCTSGHGVCGISRLSLRGIVATVFYVLAGGVMLAIARHLLGWI